MSYEMSGLGANPFQRKATPSRLILMRPGLVKSPFPRRPHGYVIGAPIKMRKMVHIPTATADLDGFGFSLKPPKWVRKLQPGKVLVKAIKHFQPGKLIAKVASFVPGGGIATSLVRRGIAAVKTAQKTAASVGITLPSVVPTSFQFATGAEMPMAAAATPIQAAALEAPSQPSAAGGTPPIGLLLGAGAVVLALTMASRKRS